MKNKDGNKAVNKDKKLLYCVFAMLFLATENCFPPP